MKHIVIALTSACVLAACTGHQVREEADAEITKDRAEGASYIIEDELNRTRTQIPGYSNHPAMVAGVEDRLKPLIIREQESLLSVLKRLAQTAEFTRLIYDLSPEAPSIDSVISKSRFETIGGGTLFGEVAEAFDEQFPDLQIFAAKDRGDYALVVSNKRYPRWTPLAIYDVQPGTLRENVAALGRAIGWQLSEHGGWQTDDYSIYASYPIVIAPSNAKQSMGTLLRSYPVQALLNQNTQTLVVTRRIQP